MELLAGETSSMEHRNSHQTNGNPILVPQRKKGNSNQHSYIY